MGGNGEIRWGILGAGSIANQLAEGVAALSDARVVAVGSRDKARIATRATTS